MSGKGDSAALSHAEALQKVWSAQPSILLCDRLAREGVALVAKGGVCPAHGGDGCLYAYGQISGIRRALSEIDGRPW